MESKFVNKLEVEKLSDLEVDNDLDLYANFNISRVFARRMINSNPEKRGKLTELLITN